MKKVHWLLLKKLGTQSIFPIFFRGLIPYRLIQIILYFLEKKKGTEYLKMGSGQPIAFVINKLRNDRRRAKAKIGKYSLCLWLCWHPGTEYHVPLKRGTEYHVPFVYVPFV
jgi:hypothetical protein